MIYLQSLNFSPASFNGPFSESAIVVSALLGSVPTEGLWSFVGWSKVGSIELAGSMATLSCQLYGSNQPDAPANTYTVTLAGSGYASSDTVSLVFGNQNLSAGSLTITYTLGSGESATTVATKLAALIGSSKLAALGFQASSLAGVITITYPSGAATGAGGSPSSPLPSNFTTVTGSASGSETVTVAAGTNGSVLGSAITALGLTAVTPLPRWVIGRITTLTGTGAAVTATFHGAA